MVYLTFAITFTVTTACKARQTSTTKTAFATLFTATFAVTTALSIAAAFVTTALITTALLVALAVTTAAFVIVVVPVAFVTTLLVVVALSSGCIHSGRRFLSRQRKGALGIVTITIFIGVYSSCRS